MYVSVNNFEEEPDQSIVCLYTGESYVHLEGTNSTLINPDHAKNAIDYLPSRFYKLPFVVRSSNGQVRVFGRLD